MITPPLSETNLKILVLLSQGKVDKEVAGIIFLSVASIKARVEKMRIMCGAKNRPHLIFIYYEQIKQNIYFLPLPAKQ